MNADDLRDSIDLYLAGLCGLICACYVVTYIMFPACMPDQTGKPGFLTWMSGKGCLPYYRRFRDVDMKPSDFPEASGTDTFNIDLFVELLEKRWNPSSPHSLFRALMWWSLPWLAFTHIFQGLPRVLDLLEPLVFSSLIAYLNSPPDTSPMWVYKLVALSVLLQLTRTVTRHTSTTVLAIRGVNPIWAGLSLMVLRTTHQLSFTSTVLMGITSTNVTNTLMDCRMMGVNLMDYTPMKTCLAEVFVGLYSLVQLYRVCGPTVAVCGVGFVFILAFLSNVSTRKQVETGGRVFHSDLGRKQHLYLMLEKFRELRMYNWTSRLGGSLKECQDEIWKGSLKGRGWGALTGLFITLVNPALTVVYYVIMVLVNGQRVDFEKGMLTFSYMVVISGSLFALSGCKQNYLDNWYRAERIENFLRMPVVSGKKSNASREKEDGPLALEGATLGFQGGPHNPEGTPIMHNVTFKVKQAELVLVTGQLGSGKSTFLSGLLGELVCLHGRAVMPEGAVAYQPQLPYLLDGTIRENILFGIPSSECNEEHLQRSLVASQLIVEMDDPRSTLHALRENTRVGKRGSQLSGGQRARVSIARSVYAALRGAEIVMLDDPLASLDNEVVSATWEAAVLAELGSFTRIVATNTQLLERLVPAADRLVVVAAPGQIVFQGTPEEAAAHAEELAGVLGGHFQLNGKSVSSQKPSAPVATSQPLDEAAKSGQQVVSEDALEDEELINDSGDPVLSLANFVRDCPNLTDFVMACDPDDLKLTPKEWRKFWFLLKKLEKSYGSVRNEKVTKQLHVGWVIWTTFIRTRATTLFMIFLELYKNAASPEQYRTIQMWAARGTGIFGSGDKAWCALLSCQVVMFAAIDIVLANINGIGCLIASSNWRREVDEQALRLGMSYFWGQAEGAEVAFRRITNLDLDSLMPLTMMPMRVVQLCFTVYMLVYYNSETLSAPGLALAVLLSAVGFYQSSQISRWKNVQLFNARMDVLTRLDLDVADQYDSVVVMRALCRSHYFESKMRVGFMKEVYWNWMRLSGELLIDMCSVASRIAFALCAAYGTVGNKRMGRDAWWGMLCWNVTFALYGNVESAFQEYMPFQNALRTFRELEVYMNTPHVEPTGGREPPVGWPAKGEVTFENVSFHYAPNLPPAIQDVSFDVKAGENLGIVGRTGSGKSTLTSLLLRLGNLQGSGPRSSGRVLLDGVDIASLRIADLRRVVVVVPQEPTVFPWSLKDNVGKEFTDAEILTVLDWCGLDARLLTGNHDDLRGALYWPIAGGITVGQSQLLMAARALVRRPKVLILDECTAAIDRENADRLLNVIRTHSQGTTVLAIAHRLRFVLTSDRILVLGHCGQILALDTPEKVMEDEKGYFATNLRLEQIDDGSPKNA